jgi:hypothetical protein
LEQPPHAWLLAFRLSKCSTRDLANVRLSVACSLLVAVEKKTRR